MKPCLSCVSTLRCANCLNVPPFLANKEGGALDGACSTFEGFLPSRVVDKCFNDKSLSTSHHMFGAFHPFAACVASRFEQRQHQRRTIMRQSSQASIVYITRLDGTESHFFVIPF